jgi:hypothetical protein
MPEHRWKSTRWRSLAVASLIAMGALQGCGASEPAGVASVAGSEISRQELAHWTRIKRLEARASASSNRAQAAAEAERKALAFLITARWLQGEAAAQGVAAPPVEAQATYEALTRGPAGPAFAHTLARRGMSRSDELFELRLDSLQRRVEARVAGAGSPAARRRALDAFVAAYRRRWRGRTTCGPGHLLPECSNGPALSRFGSG